ncbi:MAG: hypothetical protein QXK37_04835 [Candidatus Woesearchaeota archaeon]
MRKGQGALEFLMTYGWAFLVILIMIGALAYFGVLNPGRFLPDRCDFGANALCKKDQFVINNAATGTIVATLTNNLGTNIRVYGWTVTTDIPGITCNTVCFDTNGDSNCGGETNLVTADAGNPVDWQDGTSMVLIADCTGGDQMTEGDRNKFVVTYKWFATSAGAAFSKDARGEIYASVQ